jgi:transcriptional regulatory protein RtcR
MATLASGGRITAAGVEEEITRLRAGWQRPELAGASASRDPVLEVLGEARADALDRFDRAQLAEVIRVCQKARSLSEAGRLLFAASRSKKSSVNDADRLRKYLARFELEWSSLARE